MIEFLKSKIGLHFDKLLLALLFIALMAFTVHLMHKSDAGGNDQNFIVWAETQAAMILGALVGIITGEHKTPAVNPQPSADKPKEN